MHLLGIMTTISMDTQPIFGKKPQLCRDSSVRKVLAEQAEEFKFNPQNVPYKTRVKCSAYLEPQYQSKETGRFLALTGQESVYFTP